MAGEASRINGRKGGRKKAKHTLLAEEVKKLYVDKAKEYALPILKVLVEKALKGDIQAIKEFNDRSLGRPAQAITGADGKPLIIEISREIAEKNNVTT